MDIRIREGTPADAEICGRICYDAFKTVSEAHGFAPDFPAPEVPIGLLTRMIADPKFYGVVAEIDGRVVGSNFLDERNMIAKPDTGKILRRRAFMHSVHQMIGPTPSKPGFTRDRS